MFMTYIKLLHSPRLIIVLQSLIVICEIAQKTIFQTDLKNYLNTFFLKFEMVFHANFDTEEFSSETSCNTPE